MGLSILIVDDDKFVVDKIVEGVNWKNLQIGTVLTANNIRQAKEILMNLPVNILLSDIEMPQGSGLELLEWVRDSQMSVESIFLSSYAYFAYAQKALNLKSSGYLVKPVSNRELENALKPVVDRICAKVGAQEKKQDDLEEFWKEYLLEWQRSPSFLDKARQEGFYDPEQAVYVHILRVFPNLDEKKQQSPSLLQFIVRNITEEFFHERAAGELLALIKKRDYEWFLVMDGSAGKDQSINDIQEYYKCLEKTISMRCFLYAGRKYQQKDLDQCIKNMNSMVQEALPGEEGILYEALWKPKEYQYISPPWDCWEKEMLSAEKIVVTEKNLETLIENLWEEQKLTVSILERLRREMMQSIYRYLAKQAVSFESIYDGEKFEIYYEKAVRSLPDMKELVHYVYEMLAGFQRQDNRQENVVERMKQYIQEHLAEDLSRKQLAGAVYLSEDYVSKLFVSVTGTSIPAYVASCRMEKAQEYLKYTDLSVSKIAMNVGYSNFSYFSKTFRDYTGCTPNEYRIRARE